MADELSKFKEVTKLTYAEQGKFFLNAFWKEYQGEAENVWKYAFKFIELDTQKKKGGCDLDEFNAHRFLEQVGETKRVVELRETLRQIDLDFNKRMALVEYLLFRYKQTIKELISRPQGNQDEIKKAEKKLEEVQTALTNLLEQLQQQQTALDAQKKALDEQTRTAQQAQKALDDQRKAEEAVKKAEAEQRAAVDELTKQEETYKKLITDLETKSKDSGATVVQRNKAAAELAQVKQEDPLPLRKAKITQEAALRKVEKERKAAEAATAKAEEAHNKALEAQKEAEAKTAQLEEQTRKVEEAVKETEMRVKEAQDYLEEVKKSGVAQGSIWWMEREIKEAQKYLPKNKQK